MFSNVKKKINNMKVEAQKRKEEEKRLEQEKIEKERQRLLAMSEKELLIEMMFMLKDVVKETESLAERVEDLESNLNYTNFEINNLKNE